MHCPCIHPPRTHALSLPSALRAFMPSRLRFIVLRFIVPTNLGASAVVYHAM